VRTVDTIEHEKATAKWRYARTNGKVDKDVLDKWNACTNRASKTEMIDEFRKADFSIDSEYFKNISRVCN
jgi:hypothetical protein